MGVSISTNAWGSIGLGLGLLVLAALMYKLSPRIFRTVERAAGGRPMRGRWIQTRGGPLLLAVFGIVLIIGGIVHLA